MASHRAVASPPKLVLDQSVHERWTLYHGDCVEVVRNLPPHSVDYSIFSPPFSSLYVYSNSTRDMGNSRTHLAFFDHFKFLAAELVKVMRPGRLVSFHCMPYELSESVHGVHGLFDLRGELLRIFSAAGFCYASEVVIWKDPVCQMVRTKATGLLYKTLRTNASMSRQGMADYLVTVRAPGKSPDRKVTHDRDDFPLSQWQKWASPVWLDIDPSDTLQRESAREHDDEKHVCPLQLEVIRRGVRLWSNPDDVVLSPFAGIGSEGYVALEEGRRFVGVELKASYYRQAAANLERAATTRQADLFAPPPSIPTPTDDELEEEST